MKYLRKVGSTSQIFQVFIRDSSSVVGGGLIGLVFGSAGLTAYYHRDTDTTATAISLVTMTVGTFTSSGFKEIDSTNMPGWYQFCPPDAAFASGAKSVGFRLGGATNMASLPIEVDLDAQVDVSLWNGTAVTTPDIAGSPKVTLTLTQTVPTSNTAQTIGDALNAARAQGFGKWVLSGTTLTLYADDGTTAVRTFTLNSASDPTSRT